jgi:hypothetical protein
LLLDRAKVQIGEDADESSLQQTLAIIGYVPDAQVVAEALALNVDYFVSFDREHLVGNPRAEVLPFPIGTAGDFLAWYRAQLTREE